jgi:hypothetical protein
VSTPWERRGNRVSIVGKNRAAAINPLVPVCASLPWRFRGVTRVHARSSATQFLLQIALIQRRTMRREASRVSFLMYPSCVRDLLTAPTTARLT